MSHHALFAALFAAAMMSACGGGSATGSSVPPIAQAPDGDTDPPPDPVGPALLSGSVGTLALAVSGKARHVVVTNEGNHPALALSVMGTEALPTGTTVDSDCSTLAPGASCTLIITPGAAASAAPMDTNAPPVTLSVAGSNTNVLPLAVWVVDFGSVYQGGAVFDIDDTTAATGSIGGKVLGLTQHDRETISSQQSDWDSLENADSLTDGESNTRAIVEHMSQLQQPLPGNAYMAGVCNGSNEANQTGWYLPAVCELGYGNDWENAQNWERTCGSRQNPAIPNNVVSRLLDADLLANPLIDYYSSTKNTYVSEPDEFWAFWGFLLPPDGYEWGLTSDSATRKASFYCVRKLIP